MPIKISAKLMLVLIAAEHRCYSHDVVGEFASITGEFLELDWDRIARYHEENTG